MLRRILKPGTGVQGFSFTQGCLNTVGDSPPIRLAENADDGIFEEPVSNRTLPHSPFRTFCGKEGKLEGEVTKVI